MTLTLMAARDRPRSATRPDVTPAPVLSPPAAAGPRTRPPPAPPGTANSPLASCRMNARQRVAPVELALHRHEAAQRVGLPGDEEQPGVRRAVRRGSRRGRRTGGAAWPRRRSGRGRGDPDVRVAGDRRGRRPAPIFVQVHRGRLGAAGQRRAVGLAPPDDLLLVVQRAACPSRPAASGSGVRPRTSRPPSTPGSPPRRARRSAASKSGSEGLGLLVPSTWPIRLRAVIGCGGGARACG